MQKGDDREGAQVSMASALDAALGGKGTALLISGPAGIGKTHMAERFASAASSRGFAVLSGRTEPYERRPYGLFSGLGHIGSGEAEHVGFSGAFAMDRAGNMLADAGCDSADSGRLAGVLAAVRSFVSDSFGGGDEGLGRLEYGDMKIITEHASDIFLTAVFSGDEHPRMAEALRTGLGSLTGAGQIAGVKNALDMLMAQRFPVRRSLEGIKLEAERLRMADGFLDWLTGEHSESGAALLMEDIHWADESSLFVLRHIARNAGGRKIIILATMRPDETGSEGIRATLDADGCWKGIALGSLEPGETGAMVESLLPGHAIPGEFISKLAESTAGNPLYMKEILGQMVRDGAIDISGGRAVLKDAVYSIPETLEQLVKHRLESLAPEELAAAEYISCMGAEFAPEIAKDSGLLRDWDGSLDSLQRSGLLSRDEPRFIHAIFQEVTYRNISPRWHAAYHRDIGEAYERLYRAEDAPFELARHFSHTQEHTKILKYATMAGEKAEGAIAPEQASRYYEAALASAEKLGDKCAKSDLLVRCGDCNMLLGDLGKALDKYRAALDADMEDSAKASVHRKAAMVHEKMGDYAASIKDCEAGIVLLGGAREREGVMLLLAQASASIRMGITDVAMDTASKALELAREINDEKMIGACMHSLGSFHLMKGEFTKAVEYLDLAVEAKRDLGDNAGMSASLNNLGIAHYYSGQVQKALECYEQSLEIYRKIGDKYGIAAILNNLGGFTQDFGHLRKALEYHMQSLEIKEAIGDKYGIVSTLTNLGIVHRNLGELDKAIEFGERGLALSKQINNAKEILLNLNNLGEAHLESLNPGKAKEMYSLALDQSRTYKDLQQETHALRGLAKVSLARGNPAGAESHVRMALDTALNIKSTREEYQSRCTLGGVLRAGGSFDEAAKEFETALDVFRKSTGSEVEPHIYYEYGLLMKALGDRARMTEMLAKAREEFDIHGYMLMVSRIDSELAASV